MKFYNHCDLVELIETSNSFNISSRNNGIISRFFPNKNFENVIIIDNQGKGRSGNYSWHNININEMPQKIMDLFEMTKPTYNHLYNSSLEKGMCNLSNDYFEYFENKARASHHQNKDALNSKFKFIVNHSSFENLNVPFYNYLKNKGGITWACKNENIQKNIAYWLHESSLVFLWRKALIRGITAGSFAYKVIPTVNFDMPHEEFVKFEQGLANNFSLKYSIQDICKIIKNNGEL